jgi:hypothetical protein
MMKTSTVVSYVVGAVVGSGLVTFWAWPASALTAQECSAKYQAAKTAGTLNGQKWNDFRKEQCGSDAAAASAAPKTAEAKSEQKSEAKPEKKAEKKSATKPDAAPVSTGNASFPSAIDPKFAKEAPTRARLHTCAEQWKANKAANTTGGLKWIQKGGGYWSECNKRLKA